MTDTAPPPADRSAAPARRGGAPAGIPGGWIGIAVALILIAAPLITVLAAFGAGDDGGTWRHLTRTVLPGYVLNSLILMICVAAIAGVIGVTTAWLVAATEFPGRRLLGWLLVLPLAAPAYIVAYTYTDLLASHGPVQAAIDTLPGVFGAIALPSVRTMWGAALFLALVLYPYVYLLARASFATRAGTLFEAARMLGDSPARAFGRVALPAARPAIAGGLALVMMETLADFGVVDYFAIPALSTGIYRTWIGMGEKIAALKIAGVMLLFVFALVSFESLTRHGEADAGPRRPASRMALSGWHRLAAPLACALPILFGFAIPAAALGGYTLTGGDRRLGDFLSYATNSIGISAVAAVLTTALAVMLAYALRLSRTAPGRAATGRSRATAAAIRFATMGYALPGILIAIGIMGFVMPLDRGLTGFVNDTFGRQGGLILSGGLVVLAYAYVIRFLTVAYNGVNAGLSSIARSMDDAARSLGARPLAVTRLIHAPMMMRSLAAALLLVFVDGMRELPATLILRPFNFETLATRVYRLASDERLAEASTAALAIIVIGIIPVLLLNRIERAEDVTPVAHE